ncbi:hypothetical protein M9H77_07093 [Catharanthus roseus]|uniref:Uncharacterized protein n=1 Tax=Catharanthus roseus TaxID=4058 RepID=A0ACC0BU75_CATRO|nr:hypothetical protein M9H77_07093 [Catharanthus roseus]
MYLTSCEDTNERSCKRLGDDTSLKEVRKLPSRVLSRRKTVEVVEKGNPPDKLYRYFLVKNEYGGNLISCEKILFPIHWDKDHWLMFIVDILKHKITMLDSLHSFFAGKKSLVNDVRSGLHKALQHGSNSLGISINLE